MNKKASQSKKISTLEALNKKIKEHELKNIKNKANERKNEELSSYIKIGFATLTEFFSGLIVSLIIGIILDKYFDSSPIFLILFIGIGLIVGIRNIYKYVNKEL